MHSSNDAGDLTRAVELVSFTHLLVRQDYMVILWHDQLAPRTLEHGNGETSYLEEVACDRSVCILNIRSLIAGNRST